MQVMSVFKGDYISAVELGEKRPTLKISHVKVVKLEDDKGKIKDRPVVFFEGVDRGLVLCKTTALSISAMFTEETDTWVGKRVTIHSEIVQVGPERKPGVRITGSPDIDKTIKISIKLPKKKAFTVELVPTGKPAVVETQTENKENAA